MVSWQQCTYICPRAGVEPRLFVPQKFYTMADTIAINPKFTYTKTEYARAYGLNMKQLAQKIANREVQTLPVQGTVLIIAKQG